MKRQDIGKRIVAIRMSRGMSQKILAGLLDWSADKLSNVERGVSSLSSKDVPHMCDVLGVSADELLANGKDGK